MGLGPGQGDPAGKALLAQRRRGTAASLAGADDQNIR
jgi:hypothetical protein